MSDHVREATKMVSRRGFLSLAPAVAAGLVLDPERLLWVPGRRVFFDVRPVLVPMDPAWAVQFAAAYLLPQLEGSQQSLDLLPMARRAWARGDRV